MLPNFFGLIFLIGFPVNIVFISLSEFSNGKPIKVFFEIFDSILLAEPMTAFCSCINIGFPLNHDAIPAGKVIKPPKPIITSIFSFFIIPKTLKTFITTCPRTFSFFKLVWPRNPSIFNL